MFVPQDNANLLFSMLLFSGVLTISKTYEENTTNFLKLPNNEMK